MKILRNALLSLACLASTQLAAQGKIKIVVSVDWEGRELKPENLEAMESFRRDYPEIPLQMFLNAAYYVKPGAKPAEITSAIERTLRPGDEYGLHIHGWKTLVEAAGVTFRTEPAFKGPLDLSACAVDCGHDVNITSYSEGELRKIIRFSTKTLDKHGFGVAKSFRAGAWQADRKVLRALAKEGFTLDSSATDAEYLKARWGKTLLYPVIKKIWPDTTAVSQPYTIDLGSGFQITELPNNACLADYVTGEQIRDAFLQNVVKYKEDPSKDIYVAMGFHQETALKFLANLRSGIELIRAEALKEKLAIEFVVPPLNLSPTEI